MNKEEKRQYYKEYRKSNKDKIRQQQRAYCEANKNKVLQRKKEWYEANKDKSKAYYESNKEKIRQRNKEYHKANPFIRKNRCLKGTYGITFEQEKQMYVAQGGVCAICGNKFKDRKDIHLDHDHSNGKVRQLLCKHCNRGLGGFNDDIPRLLKAVEYLNKWKDN